MAKREIDLRKELEDLKNQVKSLDYIKNFSCNNEEEFKKFFYENKEDFERLKKIRERIDEIEYLLLSDSEKEERKNYLKKLNNKFNPQS